jgi:ABC-type multidrug transport system ATPase subunit
MTEVLVRVDAVTRRNGVMGVTFDLRAGEIVALLGASGSGKTALLQLAAGWLRPDQGRVTIAGHSAASVAGRRLAGFAPASPAFPPGLTVRGVLDYYARFHGPGSERRAMVAAALDLADLGVAAETRAGALPLGPLRRLALAQAALGRRRVLLLDETLDNADAGMRAHLIERLGRFAWLGGVVLLAAHNVAALERLTLRTLVLRNGVIVKDEATAAALERRILEIVLDGPPIAPPPGFRLAPFGLEVDLAGRTVEAALAVCRAQRLAVRATRVRMPSVDDVVVQSSAPS